MSNPRILVVDDNPTNLKLISDLLECEGYEILKAFDAEEAQAIIAAGPVDLVLLDIALPGMDGLTLTRKLKASPATQGLAIIALTAFAMKGDEEKARDAGCDGYITKPINTRTLPKLIAEYLPKTEPAAPKPGLNILVIEDSPAELKLAHHVLSNSGHNVLGAKAADEALEAIRKNRPHIIMLDLLLPGQDGLAVARLVKADPLIKNIPIVAVTSFPEQFTREAAMAAGCDAWIVKPFNTREITGQLEKVIQSHLSTDRGGGTDERVGG